MNLGGQPRRESERGVSNQVAVVLLIGIVVMGATVTALTGSSALSDVREQVRGEAGEKALREADARLSSLSVEATDSRGSLSLGDRDPEDVHVSRRGYLEVAVDRRAACTANVSLSSIRFEDDEGVTAYEMGGIWARRGNGSSMQSPPDLRYENGTLSMRVVNISGRIDERRERIRNRVAASDNRTAAIRSTLRTGDCARPDNVTVTVHSDFYEAWHGYLSGEVNATSIRKYDANRTVVVFLGQDRLLSAANDSRNQVVNLSGAPYNNVTVTNNSVTVEKNASVRYSLTVQPLAHGVEVSRLHSFDDQTVYRPPLDVVFVIDESGSMNDDPDGDGDTKIDDAKAATKTFVGLLNDSRDRVGLVGYSTNSHYYRTDGLYFSRDFTAVNGTIDDPDNFDDFDYTYMNRGLKKGVTQSDLKSNSSRNKVAILLSDGRNDCASCDTDDLNQSTLDWADHAASNGITVYTVGFGDESAVADGLLTDVADATGGQYYFANNSSELTRVFEDIAARVTETRAVALGPVSMNLSTGAATYYPQIAGDADHVANDTSPNGSTVYNVNDPTAPSEFSFTLTVPDGANVTMNAIAYTCEQWEATDRTVTNETTNETFIVTRCADLNESSEEVLSPSNVTIYRDGEDVSALLNDDSAWWQADLRNDTFAPYLEAGTTTLDLKSNQAVVVFDYEDDDKANNRLVVLFSLGFAESEATTPAIVQVSVGDVVVGE